MSPLKNKYVLKVDQELVGFLVDQNSSQENRYFNRQTWAENKFTGVVWGLIFLTSLELGSESLASLIVITFSHIPVITSTMKKAPPLIEEECHFI